MDTINFQIMEDILNYIIRRNFVEYNFEINEIFYTSKDKQNNKLVTSIYMKSHELTMLLIDGIKEFKRLLDYHCTFLFVKEINSIEIRIYDETEFCYVITFGGIR